MNSFQDRYRGGIGGAIPDVILILLVLNGLAYAALHWAPGFIVQYFALWPIGDFPGKLASFYPWQLLTYGFLHSMGSPTHILFNMFGLWMFGRDLEWGMGSKKFLTYYLVCVIGAGFVQLAVAYVEGGIYPTLGASGGVFGILLAYAMAFPNRMIVLIIPPIPMKAKYFVIMYGIFELYLGISGRSPSVAHFAHLGGMLFGFLLLRYWKVSARR